MSHMSPEKYSVIYKYLAFSSYRSSQQSIYQCGKTALWLDKWHLNLLDKIVIVWQVKVDVCITMGIQFSVKEQENSLMTLVCLYIDFWL